MRWSYELRVPLFWQDFAAFGTTFGFVRDICSLFTVKKSKKGLRDEVIASGVTLIDTRINWPMQTI